ncbi:hypothetical protein [Burkholderia ubonensis]|uniref:hypothetical protein n=1 Tax=Burkholderia ubonensis TaxID=101571 RepID=UPI0012F72EEF|nr:hypothetical protein [Burkholderia ubonensis]
MSLFQINMKIEINRNFLLRNDDSIERVSNRSSTSGDSHSINSNRPFDASERKAPLSVNSPFGRSFMDVVDAMGNLKNNADFKNYAARSGLVINQMRASPDGVVEIKKSGPSGNWVRIDSGKWDRDAVEVGRLARRLGSRVDYGNFDVSLGQMLKFYGIDNDGIVSADEVDAKISLLEDLTTSDQQGDRSTVHFRGEEFNVSQSGYKSMIGDYRQMKYVLMYEAGRIPEQVVSAENHPSSASSGGDGNIPAEPETQLGVPREHTDETSLEARGRDETTSADLREYAAEALIAGGATVAFVGAAAGGLKALSAAQSGAIVALGNAAVVAGGTLTAVIAPGAMTVTGAAGAGALLYRNIVALANQFGFGEKLGKGAAYVEMGGNIILFSVGVNQTAEYLEDFFKNPSIKNALKTVGAVMATTGVGVAAAPGAKDILQHARYGWLGDLRNRLERAREFEVLGTGMAAAGVTTTGAADYLPDERATRPTLADIFLKYGGWQLTVEQPASASEANRLNFPGLQR